ncbi:MAG: hypothetical protein IJJ63_03455 [Bacilli bacterium]|nr:hypothetical protein [Bacilli bacterium]
MEENNNKNEEVLTEKATIEDNTNSQVPVSTEEKKNNKALLIIVWLFLGVGLLVLVGVYVFPNFMNKPDTSTTTKQDNKEYFSEYRMTGNSLENFDLSFLKLENEEKNKVYSPLSIKYALGMLSEGANGKTKEQIDAVIGDYSSKSYPNNDHMSFANAMFIRNSFKDSVKSTYTENLFNKYNAEVIYDNFDNPDNINKWVSDKTFNLINNLIDDVSANDFFLINALAIDMNWNNQIHCESSHKIPCIRNGMYSIAYKHEKLDDDATGNYKVIDYPYSSDDQFYGDTFNKHEFNGKEGIKGGDVLADFNKYDIIKDLGEDKIREIITPEYEEWLKTDYGKDDLPVDQGVDRFINELKENYGKSANSTDFLVHEDDDVKEFAKDLQEYDGMTLQYVGIMPKKVELKKYIEDLDKEKLNKTLNELKEVNIDSFEEGYVTRIRGFIPFFKIEYELKLKKDLMEIGITDVFDGSKADLSNLSEGAAINKAVHKANIEFSNDGIKAAASTAMGGYGATTGPAYEHLFKVPVKDIDVTFNKPYMYLIRDKATGEIWFAGTVYEGITK